MGAQSTALVAAFGLFFTASGVLACEGAVRIEIEHPGVYALDHAGLQAANPALANCPSDRLRMSNRGVDVPIRVADDGDGQFGPGDRIEWVGSRLHGPESWFNAYSTVNAYRLEAAEGPHPRITDLPATAASSAAPAALERFLHLEQENLMIRLNDRQVEPWEEPDVWHWSKLTHIDRERTEIAFDLDDLKPKGLVLQAQLNLRGLSDLRLPANLEKPPEHVVELTLNGQPLTRVEFDGRDEHTHTLNLPYAQLRERGNVLALKIPKRPVPNKPDADIVDIVMLNWLRLSYPVAGDATPGQALTSATAGTVELPHAAGGIVLYGSDGNRYVGMAADGRTRFAEVATRVLLHPVEGESGLLHPQRVRAIDTSGWQMPETGYDYLMVSHQRLIDEIQPLAEFHRQRGLRVKVVDVEDVYDAYNHGITHPQAIRALASHAHHGWTAPQARFLLLVGDASFDIRHERLEKNAYAKWTNNPKEAMKPAFDAIPSTSYEDQPDDLAHRNLIPTWQFPSYEGQSASDNHFGTVDGDDFHPDVAVGRMPVVEPHEVAAIVQKTITYMQNPAPGNWRRDVMFITDESDYFKRYSDQIIEDLEAEGFAASRVYASRDEADNLAHQSAIKDGLNQGQLLVHFIGHGGRYIWRTGPPDIKKNHDLFTLDDVSQLDNIGRTPMVLSMTCYSAPFDNPTEDSIGERFLREADKGAVAVFAASWRNAPSPAYSKALVDALTAPGVTVGEAINTAKAGEKNRTLVETYNLLGDPALVLARPASTIALSGGEDGSPVQAQLPDGRFDAGLEVEWLNDDGAVIESRTVAVGASRSVLLQQPAGAAAVRAFAHDASSEGNAIGRLALNVPDAEPKAAASAAAAARAPQAATPAASAGASAQGANSKHADPAAAVKQPGI